MNIRNIVQPCLDYRFNKFAEYYGAGSRCINHGTSQSWRVNGKTMSDTGGGCYKVNLCYLTYKAQQRKYIVIQNLYAMYRMDSLQNFTHNLAIKDSLCHFL